MSDVVQIDMNGDIAVLKFNREAALNALSMELARGIAGGLIELDERDDVAGIVLTGTGERAFCAGVDLREAREVQVHEIEHGTIKILSNIPGKDSANARRVKDSQVRLINKV